MSVSTTRISPALGALVDSIRGAVFTEADQGRLVERIAELLTPRLGDPALLAPEQREPDPSRYRQHILHVEPDGSFSVVALVWLPGQATPTHDHVSWCVVGVHEGREYETRYLVERDGGSTYLIEAGRSINPPGSAAGLTPPGDIHRVVNQGPGPAISLHVYGADIGRLGSSIRRRYDLDVRPSGADGR